MATLTFDKARTGLLVIDPYNDFLSEGGKVWKRVGPIAEANQCIPHMIHVLEAGRGCASSSRRQERQHIPATSPALNGGEPAHDPPQ